ncbi:MAG: PilZ domain-containing protein [Candidatus Acidiferrales bacterium]
MTVDTERRKKLRNRPRSLVYVELESGNGGMMRDLSEEGFALRAMMPLRAGGKTQFAFSLDEVTRISGEGRMVWIKEDGRVAGIEFCGISHSAREQIRGWLDRADQPTGRESKVPAIAVAEPPSREELREEARSTVSSTAQPSVEASQTARSPEPEIARVALPRVAQPTDEAVKAAPSPEPEIAAIVIPVPPRLEEPSAEGRRALPRVVLPSVESDKTTTLPEPEIAPSALPQPADLFDLAEVPMESATAPSPEVQTELHDVSPEMSPVAALEPLVTGAAIDPLLGLDLETEFSETLDEHRASRLLLMRAIGVMLLLVLIAASVAYHRQVGHALIRLGQIIAGDEEARVPQSSIAEPPAQANPVPETAGPVSPPGVGDSSTGSLLGDRAAPSETQSAATSGVMEVPPVLPATPPSSAKTPSAPVLQPTSQQDRVPAPSNPSGAATDDGQQEYQQAEQILRNGSSETELAVAVRLLWAAVEKGNADAEVALAELYRDGKGVVRNCDQARILLTAAARKGSAEAHKRLEELMRKGCR